MKKQSRKGSVFNAQENRPGESLAGLSADLRSIAPGADIEQLFTRRVYSIASSGALQGGAADNCRRPGAASSGRVVIKRAASGIYVETRSAKTLRDGGRNGMVRGNRGKIFPSVYFNVFEGVEAEAERFGLRVMVGRRILPALNGFARSPATA